MTLRVRWLGRVAYRDALALQHGLFEHSADDHLLLLEHPPVYTLGVRADMANVLVAPASVGAELVRADRGGDVTYHGPGQLVAYPILSVGGRSGLTDTVAYVQSVAALVIDTLADFGIAARWDRRYPGVWVGDRKIAAIGVRLSRGRSMHGFALNVDPDLAMFDHIVPCGIADKRVTSMRAEGVDASLPDVVDAIAAHAAARWGTNGWERQDTTEPAPSPVAIARDRTAHSNLERRLERAGVAGGLQIGERKPEWLRAPLRMAVEQRRLQRTMRELRLVTVCEEAGCPNLSECWSDGTATFMINGERCTRACGFCLERTAPTTAPSSG